MTLTEYLIPSSRENNGYRKCPIFLSYEILRLFQNMRRAQLFFRHIFDTIDTIDIELILT